jgi:hypothetical protein
MHLGKRGGEGGEGRIQNPGKCQYSNASQRRAQAGARAGRQSTTQGNRRVANEGGVSKASPRPKAVSLPLGAGLPCTLYASCGSGGHPACRRAGRPAGRKNAPRPGKVELFASPVETRALDQAARCRQPRQAGRPPSPRLWRTGPPPQQSRSAPAVAIETDRCV